MTNHTPKPRAEKSTKVREPQNPEAGAKPLATKLGALQALLRRPEGATVDQLVEVTGWQAHSVRGAMSGALKKKLGLTISSEKTEAGRIYRIVEEAGA